MLKTAIRLVQLGVAIAKNRELLAYLFFGVLTTLINIICYRILDSNGFTNMVSTLLAWLVSVIFAFITNRKYVFRADQQGKSVISQFFGFFFARSFTGILDLAIMYFAVDVYGMNGTLWKMISNVIVIATKSDKISRGQIPPHLKVIRESLGMGKSDLLIPFSSENKSGREEVYTLMERTISQKPR